MKKLLNLVITLIMIITVILGFVGCTSLNNSNIPLLDLREAENNLEAKGYIVSTGTKLNTVYMAAENYPIVRYVQAHKESTNKNIFIIEFDTKKSAELYYNYISFTGYKQQLEWYEHLLNAYGDQMYSRDRNNLEDTLKEMKDESNLSYIFYNDRFVWITNNLDTIQDTKN